MKLTLETFLAIWLILGAIFLFGLAHLAHIYPVDPVMFRWIFIPSILVYVFVGLAGTIKAGAKYQWEEFKKSLEHPEDC